jgi:hypothetical protein
VMGSAQPKVKCYKCGQWGHKRNKCPGRRKKNSGGDKSKNKGHSSKKEEEKCSTKKCHFCKKKEHVKKTCFKWNGQQENIASDIEGNYSHVDGVLTMEDGVEVVMDRKQSPYCGVCTVEGRTTMPCKPSECPLMDRSKHPYMEPIAIDSDEGDAAEDEMRDVKVEAAVAKTNKNYHFCGRCKITEQSRDCCRSTEIDQKKYP